MPTALEITKAAKILVAPKIADNMICTKGSWDDRIKVTKSLARMKIVTKAATCSQLPASTRVLIKRIMTTNLVAVAPPVATNKREGKGFRQQIQCN